MAARRTVTVVFSDIANSTPLGEALDPEVMRGVMEQYYFVVRQELERHGGTVEKFIGDAVMAVFGIPKAHDDDALRAVRAAVDMRTALGALNQELEHTHNVRLAIRTGVNTGEVVAGDPTDRQSFATGAAVATTQRLEAAARSGEILLGDSTYRLVSNAVLVEPMEPLSLKGKAKPVKVWRLLGVVEGAPPFPRRLDTPMVGRVEELAALHGELDVASRERRCRLATVVGPAGIGKSKLGNELFARTRGAATTLVGRCLAYGEGITYWPLRGVVLAATGSLTRQGIQEFVADAPDADLIAERLAGAVGTSDPPPSGEETFWAVRRFLEHLARERPVILGIDELQWAEPTFLDLLEYLVGWTRDAPVLILGLGRPELLEARPTWRSTSSLVLSLEPLSGADSRRLVEVLGEGEIEDAERERILAGAEGNPLFMEQMLALSVEDGQQETMPPSIQALLAARLDRLSEGERAAVERAAVIGREFTAGAVGSLSDGEPVASTLLSLVRRDLIEPDRSLIPGDDGFRFRHILIRDAAYLALAKESRAALHERYADWLLRAASDLDEIIGYHLEQAFRYRQELGATDSELAAQAGERLARAGTRAVQRGDSPAAVALLTRATALLPDGHSERRELLPVLGSALMRTGDFHRAERVLIDALEAAQSAGDRRLELRTLIERELFRSFTSSDESVEDIVAVADSAIPLLQELGDDLGLAKAWWLKSEVHVHACRWHARGENLERALEYARAAGDRSEQSTLASQLAVALYCGPTPVDEAIERCERLLAELPDDRSLRASVTGSIAGLRAMRGEFEEARRLREAARALSEELGHRFRIAARSLIAAEIEALAGRPDEATAILHWAFGELEEMGASSVMSTVAAFLADALASEGSIEDAIRFSEVSEQHAADLDIATQVMWRVARANATGELALAREAVELARPTDYTDIRARALLAVGDSDGAAREYERKGNTAGVRRVVAAALRSS
ncbi:MAG TPA: adenylate/guanylate cyclase domain-containing protein [Gaiellaceae bacterium]|nr:adenylate/guanylate cyclase domain-containing protein [Gaiellaceae bacterium]HET8653768.1 adenylate/guanylate cyclase domain-containing protein [Gaiellaceae bacterium]